MHKVTNVGRAGRGVFDASGKLHMIDPGKSVTIELEKDGERRLLSKGKGVFSVTSTGVQVQDGKKRGEQRVRPARSGTSPARALLVELETRTAARDGMGFGELKGKAKIALGPNWKFKTAMKKPDIVAALEERAAEDEKEG